MYLGKKLKNLKKRQEKRSKSEGVQESSVLSLLSKLRDFEVPELLTAINILKVGVLKESRYFELEESYADFTIFCEKVCEALTSIERYLLPGVEEELDEGSLEVLLMLCSNELFPGSKLEELDEDVTLTEFFMSGNLEGEEEPEGLPNGKGGRDEYTD